eukprot:SAG25_NODE_17_length_24192_cov_70.399452_7_plen_365_part_00
MGSSPRSSDRSPRIRPPQGYVEAASPDSCGTGKQAASPRALLEPELEPEPEVPWHLATDPLPPTPLPPTPSPLGYVELLSPACGRATGTGPAECQLWVAAEGLERGPRLMSPRHVEGEEQTEALSPADCACHYLQLPEDTDGPGSLSLAELTVLADKAGAASDEGSGAGGCRWVLRRRVTHPSDSTVPEPEPEPAEVDALDIALRLEQESGCPNLELLPVDETPDFTALPAVPPSTGLAFEQPLPRGGAETVAGNSSSSSMPPPRPALAFEFVTASERCDLYLVGTHRQLRAVSDELLRRRRAQLPTPSDDGHQSEELVGKSTEDAAPADCATSAPPPPPGFIAAHCPLCCMCGLVSVALAVVS